MQQGQPGIAVAALTCGITGLLTSWCCVGIPLSIAAIVTGIIGRQQAQQRGFSPAMATAGLVLGIVGLAIVILLFIVGVATTNFNDIKTGS